MDKKFYTFLIFPGAHGKLHKIRLPFYFVHMVLAFSVVGIMTIAALANSYARMLLKVSNYNSLRTEREALKTQNRSLENVVTTDERKVGLLAILGLGSRFDLRLWRSPAPAFSGSGAIARDAIQFHPRVQLPSFALRFQSDQEFFSRSFPSIPCVGIRSQPQISGVKPCPLSGRFAGGSRRVLASAWILSVGKASSIREWIFPPRSAPALSAGGDGIVMQAGWDSGYGNAIMVDHGYGLATKYGHLSKIFVVVGQEVKRGQVIGAVGMTGRTTGPHLHYEVIVNDTPVNPMKYLHE